MTLPDEVLGELDRLLADADAALAAGWPGEPATRQPVHTLYLPADHPLVGPAVVDRVGAAALEAVEGEDAASMARVTGIDRSRRRGGLAPGARQAGRQPVEDLRLDLEDGYGTRSDADEDWDATRVGEVLADGSPGTRHRWCAACGSSRWRHRPGAAACGRSTWWSGRWARPYPRASW